MRRRSRQGDHEVDPWRAWWEASGRRELVGILMTAWDPIGVGDTVEAWDEYDDYAPGVAHRLRDAAGADEAVDSVAAYLDHVERDLMGMARDDRRYKNRSLAEQLVAWHEWSFERGGRPPHQWIDD
jgi:hypothetical protein